MAVMNYHVLLAIDGASRCCVIDKVLTERDGQHPLVGAFVFTHSNTDMLPFSIQYDVALSALWVTVANHQAPDHFPG